MQANGNLTRILVIDSDETSFEIRRCMAKALEELPPVELIHARDATEALALLETLTPDVIILDDEEPGECDLFIDSLSANHPPIVLCTEEHEESDLWGDLDQEITYIPKNESLYDFHQTLKIATAIGLKFVGSGNDKIIH